MFNMIRHAILVLLFHSTNAAIRFPASLARKIPECAQECVLSFLNVNYNSVDHASLETLCSKNGASGFTLGEGAVQCVTAERRVHYCSDEEVDDEVVNRAYRICDGVDGAVRPTHGVITAVLQGTPDGGAMTFPPVVANPSSPSSSTSTSSTPRPTHKTTTSERRSSTVEPTTTTPATTAEPTSSASSTESPTSTEVPAGVNNNDNDNDPKPSLSPAKIAGISAGAVSGFAALIGLFFLARYLIRRRKRPSSRQYHDSWMFNPDRGKEIGYHTRSSSDDLPHKSFPTIRPVPPTIKPYKRDSYRSSAIGLAVSASARASPELNRTKTPQPQTPSQAVPLARSRPVSKLLPDKPDLPPLPTLITQSTQPGRGLTPPPSGQYQTLQSTIPAALPPLPTQPSGLSPTIRAVSYEPPTLQVQAATPSTSHTPPTTNVDRAVPALLPKIYIPKRGEAPKSFTSPPPAIHPRQSVITEFEEDTQPSSSSSGALRAISPAGQTWFPPSAGPQSPTSVAYIADGNGKWRLRPSRESSQTQKHVPSTQNQDELHFATAELAASNQTITKPLTSPTSPPPPSTKSPDLSSVRLSRATMPSPLFRQGHPSPRSISQPTTSHGLYPAPLQPRSASASATHTRQSQHSQRSQQSQKLSPVVESPQVRQYPNSGPTHRLYNPAIPHSTGHSTTQDDDRSMLPSHARHRPVQPPSSTIRHNYPLHPSLRSGPGPNPLGIPHPAPRPYYPIYPPQQVQMQQSQQQQYQRQSYQNQIRNYPYQPATAPAPAPVQPQMYQQPLQQRQYTPYSYQSQQPTDYPGSPQSIQNKRLGPNAPTMKIDSPSLSGDPRWRRQVDGGMRPSATPSTAIPWMDQ